jgi:hypothetical protein
MEVLQLLMTVRLLLSVYLYFDTYVRIVLGTSVHISGSESMHLYIYIYIYIYVQEEK